MAALRAMAAVMRLMAQSRQMNGRSALGRRRMTVPQSLHGASRKRRMAGVYPSPASSGNRPRIVRDGSTHRPMWRADPGGHVGAA